MDGELEFIEVCLHQPTALFLSRNSSDTAACRAKEDSEGEKGGVRRRGRRCKESKTETEKHPGSELAVRNAVQRTDLGPAEDKLGACLLEPCGKGINQWE